MMQDDPTGDDRHRELTQILAVGILRLRMSSSGLPPSGGKNLSESGQDCLEVSEETVLTVHTGKRFPRLGERSET